jgi:hypothetical protein
VWVVKPWIATRITELMGMEDDVVILFVITQLEEGFKVWPCRCWPPRHPTHIKPSYIESIGIL